MKQKKLIVLLALLAIFSLIFVACGKPEIKINGFQIDFSQVDLELELGEELDLSKIKVSATRDDGTSISLNASDYTIDLGGFDKDKEGSYTITIKYKNYPQQSFIVEVKDTTVAINYIQLAEDSQQQTSFAYGEDFNYQNLRLLVVYADGKEEIISEGFEVDSSEFIKNHNELTQPEYGIKVTYKNIEITYSVAVAINPKFVAKSIAVKSAKTFYNYAEDFDNSIVLELTMMDNSKQDISVDYIVNYSQFNSIHKQEGFDQTYTIGVSYQYRGITLVTSYEVVVASANVVSMSASTLKTNYKYGQEFCLDDIVFFANFADGNYKEQLELSNEYGYGKFVIDYSNYDAKYSGTYQIVARYSDDIIYSYNVTVAERPQLVGYEVAENSAHKTVFGAGESFDYDGLVVMAIYGSELENNLYQEVVDLQDLSIYCSGFDNTANSQYMVYCNGLPLYLVSVVIETAEKTVENIYAANFKESYYVGESIDLWGSYIAVQYDDSSFEYIFLPSANVSISNFNSATPQFGLTLTIAYEGVTTSIDINIVEDAVERIEITSGSNHRTKFYTYENFSSDGLVVKAIYISGKFALLDIFELDINSSDYDNYKYTGGTATITIDYNGNYYYYFVEISPKTTAPEDIIYSNASIYASAVEKDDGRWSITYSQKGYLTIKVELGEDSISTVSAMLGRYHVGEEFYALSIYKYEYENAFEFVAYFDGTNAVEYTIRIQNADDGFAYHYYLTIEKEKALLERFSVNGEDLDIVAGVYDYIYQIKDSSNKFILDWTVADGYEFDVYRPQNVWMQVDSNNMFENVYIDIILNGNSTAYYVIRIMPYLFLVSVEVNSEEAELYEPNYNSEHVYFMRWEDYDISESYSYDLTAKDGYTARMAYLGVGIESIEGKMLFLGQNEFEIIVKDSNDKIIVVYRLVIEIGSIDSLVENVSLGETNLYLNYYAGLNWLGTYDEVAEGDYQLLIILKDLDATVSIKDSDWQNGGEVTINSGRNIFVLLIEKDGSTYQTYLILYSYRIGDNDFWNNHYVEVHGTITQEIATLPDGQQLIIIPNGFDYSDIASILKVYSNDGEEQTGFSCAIVDNFIVIEFNGMYAYIQIIIDGEVNDDTQFDIVVLDLMDRFNGIFEKDALEIDYYSVEETIHADISIAQYDYLWIKSKYFTMLEYVYNYEYLFYQETTWQVIAQVGTTFGLTIIVTASSGKEVTYILHITVVEAESLITLDFGEDNIIKYSFWDIFMISEGSTEEYLPLVIDINSLATGVINQENATATFAIISNHLFDLDNQPISSSVQVFELDEENKIMFVFYIQPEDLSYDSSLPLAIVFSDID